MDKYISGAILILVVWLAFSAWRLRRRRVGIGPGAAGMMHEILDEDQRAAVEIILEERTAYRDPEDRDGNLPGLERLTGGSD